MPYQLEVYHNPRTFQAVCVQGGAGDDRGGLLKAIVSDVGERVSRRCWASEFEEMAGWYPPDEVWWFAGLGGGVLR
jgi:hypothetical protein